MKFDVNALRYMSNDEFRTSQVMFPYSTIAPTDLPGLSLEEFEGFYSMMSPGGNLPPSCTGGPMSYDYSYSMTKEPTPAPTALPSIAPSMAPVVVPRATCGSKVIFVVRVACVYARVYEYAYTNVRASPCTPRVHALVRDFVPG